MIHLNLWFLMQALTTQGVKSLVHGNTNSLWGCLNSWIEWMESQCIAKRAKVWFLFTWKQ